MADGRDERLRRERDRAEDERKRHRIGNLIAAALVLATVAVLGFVLLSGGGGSEPPAGAVEKAQRTAASAGCRLRAFPGEGRTHTTGPVSYGTNPPTSGDHHPVPAPDGEYANGPPRAEHYVHTLEHGRIELQYRSGASATARAGLRSVFEQDSEHMLLFANNTGMPYVVAATAWRHLLGCPAYNARVPAALRAFRDAYRDTAPERVP